MEEKLYSVSEAVRLIGVESHVLRYWEEELEIAIQRTKQGHRVYSAENITTFRQVKELKEKGIQLKAIRVLLEETEPTEEQAKIKEQIEEFRRRTREGVRNETQTADPKEKKEPGRAAVSPSAQKESEAEEFRGEQENGYEIVMHEAKPDNLRQFERILKRMITEVVEEQNEKMEQAIMQMLRNELEELYLQYFQSSMSEAAASKEMKTGIWYKIWNYIKRGS